eukprot:m.34173 g.34173  ORF g.34173 m.34173 type:complete len:56 (-) comp12277_c0_seq4:1300-1467(-)
MQLSLTSQHANDPSRHSHTLVPLYADKGWQSLTTTASTFGIVELFKHLDSLVSVT